MIRFFALISFALILCLPCAGSYGEIFGVRTLEQAFLNAYKNNPGLRAERAALRATEEELPQATANWRPSMELSAGVTAQNITGENVDNQTDGAATKDAGLSVSQPLYRGGRTFAERDEALHNISAERANLLQEEQALFLKTAETFTNIIKERAILELQTKNEELLAQRLINSRKRYEGGESTKTDVSQSEARLAKARSDRIDAQASLETAIGQFENLVGYSPAGDLKIPDLREKFFPAETEQLVNKALQNKPSVLEAHYEHLAAIAEIDVEKRALYPQLSLSASYKYEDDPQPGTREYQDTQNIGLRMRVPFYQGGAVRSRVREAKSLANQKKLELIQEIQDTKESVLRNWQEYNAAKARIQAHEIQAQAAITAREGVFQEVQAGERAYIDLLDADQEVLDSTVDLVIAKRTAILEEYALLADMGLLNAEFLQIDTGPSSPKTEKTFAGLIKQHFTFDVYQDPESSTYIDEFRERQNSTP